jgi:hypothetical protein
MSGHVVILLTVTDPVDPVLGIRPFTSRTYYESHDAAFKAYQEARDAGFEATAEKVMHRTKEGASS